MKFNIGNTRDHRDFDKIEIGEIFLDDSNYPYIKTSDVWSCYNNDMYNCVNLSDGQPYYFQNNEQVHIPIRYNLQIDT